MRGKRVSLMLGFCLALCLGADSSVPAKLHFSQLGFSIAPLSADAKGATFTALTMFIPPANNFAANVNVQIQAYADTMDAYITLSKQQLDQMKLEMIRADKTAPDTCVFEYKGTMGDRTLHFYSRGILKSGAVYLATATATEDQWATVSDNFKGCVDSFQLDAPAGAQP
jgi:hypothetical protein